MLGRLASYLLHALFYEAAERAFYAGEECEDATVLEVVDGDTIRFAEWPERCRLEGVDTPELDGAEPGEAFAAKATVEAWLDQAARIHVQQVGRGAYGRPIVRVEMLSGGTWENLSEKLREAGYG